MDVFVVVRHRKCLRPIVSLVPLRIDVDADDDDDDDNDSDHDKKKKQKQIYAPSLFPCSITCYTESKECCRTFVSKLELKGITCLYSEC